MLQQESYLVKYFSTRLDAAVNEHIQVINVSLIQHRSKLSEKNVVNIIYKRSNVVNTISKKRNVVNTIYKSHEYYLQKKGCAKSVLPTEKWC